MTDQSLPAALLAMIERAGSLTADETRALGDLWEADEEWEIPWPSWQLELQGGINPPVATNRALVEAWQRTLDAAGNAGRVEVIEAARAAGRASRRDVRHLPDSPSEKNGCEEAARAAVLAVGVKDLIPEEDYRTLVAPWEKALGAL